MPSRVKSQLSIPVYLGAATRSPIGKFGGSLSWLPAPQLAALTLKAAIARSVQDGKPDFVMMGHARQAGAGPNLARQAAIFAGLPESTPALTINQACASGLTSIISAAEKIQTRRAHFIWAGGVESMSNTPYLLMNARFGYRMGNAEAIDGMVQDGFQCPMADMLMGATVENFIAKELKISRADQDEFALLSQSRAAAAWKAGHFAKEISAIAEGGRRKPGLDHDEHMRANSSLESLSKLKPVFDTENGSVTAGNSSGITDGAAFLSVSDQKSSDSMAEIIDYETVALDPKRMGLGPIAATENLLKRNKLKAQDIEAIELNEAFAAQALACMRALKLDPERVNQNGGAIALGHPIGCTGTRIVVTLMHQIAEKQGALAIATLCVSGGQGVALLIKSV